MRAALRPNLVFVEPDGSGGFEINEVGLKGDPLDPQRILDDLPAGEHGFFLDQYREAVDKARDPAGWKQLRRVLRLWRFHADAAGDPGYRAALDAACGPVSGGMALEAAVRTYRPAS